MSKNVLLSGASFFSELANPNEIFILLITSRSLSLLYTIFVDTFQSYLDFTLYL